MTKPEVLPKSLWPINGMTYYRFRTAINGNREFSWAGPIIETGLPSMVTSKTSAVATVIPPQCRWTKFTRTEFTLDTRHYKFLEIF